MENDEDLTKYRLRSAASAYELTSQILLNKRRKPIVEKIESNIRLGSKFSNFSLDEVLLEEDKTWLETGGYQVFQLPSPYTRSGRTPTSFYWTISWDPQDPRVPSKI